MEKVLYNADKSVAFFAQVGAVVSTDVKKLTRPNYSIDKIASTRNVMYWGDGNDFPQQVIADVRKDPEIGTLLNKQASLLYSGGVSWGIPKKVNGKLVYEDLPESDDKLVRQWWRRTNGDKYIAETAKDLYWFYNAFTEIVLDGSGKNIIQLCAQAAEECRFGPQNPKSGIVDTCFMNAQWPSGGPGDDFTKELPVLDCYYDPATQLATNAKSLNYIYPLSIATPGNKFYQLADWNSIRESGWMEVSQAIPQFKKALLANQMTVKYHIQISSLYWEIKYTNWTKMSDAEKMTAIETETTAMEETLTNAVNAGKSIRSGVLHNKNYPQYSGIELVKITPIDDIMKDGKYLEDGKDASFYKSTAIGLHPALGMMTAGMSGAGSNIREAYNLHIFMAKAVQDESLSCLNNVVVPFNRFPEEMVFYYNNQQMTTMDAGKEVKSTTGTVPTTN